MTSKLQHKLSALKPKSVQQVTRSLEKRVGPTRGINADIKEAAWVVVIVRDARGRFMSKQAAAQEEDKETFRRLDALRALHSKSLSSKR